MRLDFLIRKSQAYKQVFAGVHADVVLADLANFCFANKPTFVPGDPHSSAYSEGRREVWLRINSYMNLSQADIERLKNDK